MTAWTNDPTVAIQSLIPGVPAYSAGSLRSGPPCKMIIDHDSVSANVVTLSVTVVEGNIPSIGDILYVYATTNNAGGLNEQTGLVTVASVSITAATGKGTITYALTTGNLANTPDTGYAIAVPGETAEASVPNQAYRAFAIQKLSPELGANRSATISVTEPSAPAAIKWTLQAAMRNVDSEYVEIIKDITSAGTFSDSGAPGFTSATTQFWPGSWNFVRYKDTGSSGGTNPTVIAKIMI